MRGDLPESPPLEPKEEIVLLDEPTFLNACKTLIAEDAEKFEWSFGKSLLTRSERWGLIWRVDFVTRYSPAPNCTNRIMCWRDASGSAIGLWIAFSRPIAPL